MKEYPFEYTKQGIAYLLFLLLFVIIGLVAVVLGKLFPNFLLADILLSIIVGVLFFLLNKHRIKKTGKADLSETGVVFELSDNINIKFSDLKYYYIYDGKNGIVFTLGLLDGTKFKIGANNNFCNVEPLKSLLIDIQEEIEKYKTQNQVNIIHLKSILARKNAVYVLSFITVLIILGFIFTKMPVMIVSIAFTLPILINWIQYFRLKNDNQLVDF